MEINEVRQGTRVTYAIGETEYDAIALGSITTGINKAINAPGFFLTLRYLNEQGTPITIFGAPLLGRDADIKVARHRLDTDPRAQDASEDEKDDLFEAHLNEIKANPRTTGWHLREADDAKRAEPKVVQPAPEHEIAQMPREVPNAVLGMPVPQEPAGNTLYERLKANTMRSSMLDSEEFKIGDKVRLGPTAIGGDPAAVYTIDGGERQPDENGLWFWRLTELPPCYLFLGSSLVPVPALSPAEQVFEEDRAKGLSAEESYIDATKPETQYSQADQDLIDAAEKSKAELAAAEDGNTTADQPAEQKDTAEPTA